MKKITIGITIGILATFILGGIILAFIYKSDKSLSHEEEKIFIYSSEFQQLDDIFKKNITVKTIGVFLEDEYITINNLTVDFKRRTYGINDGLPFIRNFYEAAGKNKIEGQIEDIFLTNGIKEISENDLLDIKNRMKKLGLSDIYKIDNSSENIVYYIENSMWGSSGLIFSKNIDQYLRDKDYEIKIWHIDGNFYGFDES